MTKPNEIQIAGLYSLIEAMEARSAAHGASYRKQVDTELANGSLTSIGAIGLIKDLRYQMGK